MMLIFFKLYYLIKRSKANEFVFPCTHNQVVIIKFQMAPLSRNSVLLFCFVLSCFGFPDRHFVFCNSTSFATILSISFLYFDKIIYMYILLEQAQTCLSFFEPSF